MLTLRGSLHSHSLLVTFALILRVCLVKYHSHCGQFLDHPLRSHTFDCGRATAIDCRSENATLYSPVVLMYFLISTNDVTSGIGTGIGYWVLILVSF